MKNLPETIFLQIGDPTCLDFDGLDGINFDELREVTWNRSQIFCNDIEFVRKDTITHWHRYDSDPPQNKVLALVYYPLGYEVRMAFKHDDGRYKFGLSNEGHNALAWMELPELPKRLLNKKKQ